MAPDSSGAALSLVAPHIAPEDTPSVSPEPLSRSADLRPSLARQEDAPDCLETAWAS